MTINPEFLYPFFFFACLAQLTQILSSLHSTIDEGSSYYGQCFFSAIKYLKVSNELMTAGSIPIPAFE